MRLEDYLEREAEVETIHRLRTCTAISIATSSLFHLPLTPQPGPPSPPLTALACALLRHPPRPLWSNHCRCRLRHHHHHRRPRRHHPSCSWVRLERCLCCLRRAP